LLENVLIKLLLQIYQLRKSLILFWHLQIHHWYLLFVKWFRFLVLVSFILQNSCEFIFDRDKLLYLLLLVFLDLLELINEFIWLLNILLLLCECHFRVFKIKQNLFLFSDQLIILIFELRNSHLALCQLICWALIGKLKFINSFKSFA